MLNNLKNIDFSLLKNNKIGIEREVLRVDGNGNFAKTKHPDVLGSKLTNEVITVDFSESLYEFITPPYSKIDDCLSYLKNITAYSIQKTNKNEHLWTQSMPPLLNEQDISLAKYGNNSMAKMKEIYRNGLTRRYGKTMQVISGIHYNFSFTDEFINNLYFLKDIKNITEKKNITYFKVLNEFNQNAWLLPYLFGATPICANSSLNINASYVEKLDDNHVYGKYATSLRMSDIGYTSHAQSTLTISTENVESYVKDILTATNTAFPLFTAIGVLDEDGEYLQLNGNILQLENEYYSIMRPKQIAKNGERPVCALLKRGVCYTEVRLLDVDPFTEIGIEKNTVLFMEVFLIWCLIKEKNESTAQNTLEGKSNFFRVVTNGRDPKLELTINEKEKSFYSCADEILQECILIANEMGDEFLHSVNSQIEKLNDSTKTPSAILLSKVKESKLDYHTWMNNQSKYLSEKLRNHKIDKKVSADLDDICSESLKVFQDLEESLTTNLEEYMSIYFESCRI